jgi:hypothetical protein
MTSACRLLWRWSAGFAAGLLLLGVVSLDRVDHRPYFREPWYAETTARLHAHQTTNAVTRGVLSAGFGRARLTPTTGAASEDPARGQFRLLPLAGYGERRGRPATGVHDELYVKALALRVGDQLGVLVAADALIIPREVANAAAERLEAELKLSRAQLYLGATHTHCSLGAWGEGPVAEAFAGPFQPGARVWFANCIVAAVREALSDLRPAAVGHGRFAAPAFVRNRLVGALGRVDPEFSFLVVRRDEERPAVVGSFAAHATVLGGDVMLFSGDYPGAWQRAVEEATGGPALFLAGGVGSHSPVPGEKGFAGIERMGRALAGELLEHLPRVPLTNVVAFGMAGLEVTLPPLNWRVSDDLRLRPWLARRLLRPPERSFLQALRVGDVVWLSTPCDFSGELALALKDTLRARGFDAVVTSFNGDYVGYVIPPRYYHLGGYEPRLMSFYGPYLPDYFTELLRDLALHLAGQ